MDASADGDVDALSLLVIVDLEHVGRQLEDLLLRHCASRPRSPLMPTATCTGGRGSSRSSGLLLVTAKRDDGRQRFVADHSRSTRLGGQLDCLTHVPRNLFRELFNPTPPTPESPARGVADEGLTSVRHGTVRNFSSKS
jgi:hypothetical protein